MSNIKENEYRIKKLEIEVSETKEIISNLRFKVGGLYSLVNLENDEIKKRNLELEILAYESLIEEYENTNKTRGELILTYKTLNQVNNN